MDSHVNAEARNTNETFMSLLKAIDLGSYSYLRNHPATATAFFAHSSGQLFSVNLWFAYAQKKKQFIQDSYGNKHRDCKKAAMIFLPLRLKAATQSGRSRSFRNWNVYIKPAAKPFFIYTYT